MKTMMMALLLIGQAAFATSTTGFTPTFDLEKFVIGAGSTLPSADTLSGGQILINSETKELMLTLNHKNPCVAGHFCSFLLMAPIQITLPIIATETLLDGSTVIVAQGNDLTTIQVVNSPTVRAIDKTTLPVDVLLTQIDPNTKLAIVSDFSGEVATAQ